MKFFVQLRRIIALFVLASCLYNVGRGQETGIEALQGTNEINKKLVNATSMPNITKILDYLTNGLKGIIPLSSNFLIRRVLFNFDKILNSKDGKCSDDIIQVFHNLDTMWAFQMIDSAGKISSATLRGGRWWPGQYSQCIDTYAPLDENGHGDFHGKYCLMTFKQYFYKAYPIFIGVCVPNSCSSENIRGIVMNASKSLYSIWKSQPYIEFDNVICTDENITFDIASIIYLCIIFIMVILVVLGSLLSLFDRQKNEIVSKNQLNGFKAQYCDNLGDEREFQIACVSTEEKENSLYEVVLSLITGIFQFRNIPSPKEVLLCFSVFSNGNKILDTKTNDGQLQSIHGLRVLNFVWLVAGHALIIPILNFANPLDALDDMKTFLFQIVTRFHFGVDSFFLLSGLFLAYLFLKKTKKGKGNLHWILKYRHRLWRLTPPYLVVVFFYMLIFNHLGSGPFWEGDKCERSRSSWWKYVLYLNNFIPIREMCPIWLWYMPADILYHIISPLFLYPLLKWPGVGYIIIGIILSATWIINGVLTYLYGAIPLFSGFDQFDDYEVYKERTYDSFDLLYDKPYCRIDSFIIGVTLGYILHKTGGRRNFLDWSHQLLGWVIALLCTSIPVFGLYFFEVTTTVAVLYNAFSRTCFAIGLSWIIYACETGHGGFLAKFLSWKFFVPLSYLSYSAYLVHGIPMGIYYGRFETALYFTKTMLFTNVIAFVILIYGLAFVFSLVFESPFSRLEHIFMKIKAD